MTDRDSERPSAASSPKEAADDLPYRIELWTADKHAVERLLARAASISLGQAIFVAARREYPDRHITLSDGIRIITQAN